MKFNLNVKCFNCEEYFCPTTNTDAGIMEAANNCGYHLWEDEFYCDKCETPDEEITSLRKDIVRLEQEKEVLNNKRGRAEFARSVYETMYNEQKSIVEKLMKEKLNRSNGWFGLFKQRKEYIWVRLGIF